MPTFLWIDITTFPILPRHAQLTVNNDEYCLPSLQSSMTKVSNNSHSSRDGTDVDGLPVDMDIGVKGDSSNRTHQQQDPDKDVVEEEGLSDEDEDDYYDESDDDFYVEEVCV